MSIECPYCNFEQEVDHNEGENYEEDVEHQMQCEECEKYFIFYTDVTFSYTPYKAACLNGEEHNYKPTHTFPKEFTQMRCVMCGEERDCTEEELKQVLNG